MTAHMGYWDTERFARTAMTTLSPHHWPSARHVPPRCRVAHWWSVARGSSDRLDPGQDNLILSHIPDSSGPRREGNTSFA